mmetsp:Transcript_54136/g.123352  ORF Transcript_54136/g.123352 Transcript_54136/m.123352 type:complete len:225 (-) Transcript_54136:52-726(-)
MRDLPRKPERGAILRAGLRPLISCEVHPGPSKLHARHGVPDLQPRLGGAPKTKAPAPPACDTGGGGGSAPRPGDGGVGFAPRARRVGGGPGAARGAPHGHARGHHGGAPRRPGRDRARARPRARARGPGHERAAARRRGRARPVASRGARAGQVPRPARGGPVRRGGPALLPRPRRPGTQSGPRPRGPRPAGLPDVAAGFIASVLCCVGCIIGEPVGCPNRDSN